MVIFLFLPPPSTVGRQTKASIKGVVRISFILYIFMCFFLESEPFGVRFWYLIFTEVSAGFTLAAFGTFGGLCLKQEKAIWCSNVLFPDSTTMNRLYFSCLFRIVSINISLCSAGNAFFEHGNLFACAMGNLKQKIKLILKNNIIIYVQPLEE